MMNVSGSIWIELENCIDISRKFSVPFDWPYYITLQRGYIKLAAAILDELLNDLDPYIINKCRNKFAVVNFFIDSKEQVIVIPLNNYRYLLEGEEYDSNS